MSRSPIILFFLFLSITLCSFRKEKEFDPDRKFTIEELQTDIDAWRKAEEKKQPNLYLYSSKAQVDSAFDALRNGITAPMTVSEFYFYITPVMSVIRDGHNLIAPGKEMGRHADKHEKYFPLHLSLIDGKVYADMNCTRDSAIYDGAQIFAINGTEINALKDDFLKRMVRDGNNETLPVWVFNAYFRGFYGAFTNYPDSFHIVFNGRNGGRMLKTIPALPIDSIVKIRKQKYKPRLDAQLTRIGMKFHFDSATRTPVISIQTFDPHLLKKYYHVHFKKLLDQFMQKVDSAKSGRLIIDLRDNNGGNPAFSLYLLRYLMPGEFVYAENTFRTRRFPKPDEARRVKELHMRGFGKGKWKPFRHRFNGKVIVLINGGSFSAAGEFASVLQRYHQAVFVGEETGGNKTICGGQMFSTKFVFPNTQLICNLGTEATLIRPITENNGHGVVPDHVVRNSIEDIISGRDAVMEYGLQLVE